jgi:hypothetical protein
MRRVFAALPSLFFAALAFAACGSPTAAIPDDGSGKLTCVAGQPCTCGANAKCTGDCAEGNCAISCGDNSNCNLECSGGGCTLQCGDTAVCTLKDDTGTSKIVCGHQAVCTCTNCK